MTNDQAIYSVAQNGTQSVPSWAEDVAPDVVGLRIAIVNVFFIGEANHDNWVLVDGGVGPCAGRIVNAAEECFGVGAKPSCILLTHGHFDHIGALRELADRWEVPIYAHPLELPYLTGRSDYPPPDPTVGGGSMARLSFLYSRKGIDLGERIHALPDDGRVPHLPEWRWIATPGHSPGHISLFRNRDGVLVAGDAVITTKQESLLAVLTQEKEVRRPPAYFTPDWKSAGDSVRTIAALQPSVIATGHGQPMRGAEMQSELQDLAAHFETEGVPLQGRYIDEPAHATKDGVVYIPPAVPDPVTKMIIGSVLGTLALLLLRSRRKPKAESRFR